jgi:hypothetical protein
MIFCSVGALHFLIVGGSLSVHAAAVRSAPPIAVIPVQSVAVAVQAEDVGASNRNKQQKCDDVQ